MFKSESPKLSWCRFPTLKACVSFHRAHDIHMLIEHVSYTITLRETTHIRWFCKQKWNEMVQLQSSKFPKEWESPGALVRSKHL
jgi:hypothetical protein